VLKVRDLAVAERFYGDILGMTVAARQPGRMTFFTLGNHHDFAVLKIDGEVVDAPQNAPGLFHVAFKIGDSIDDLREAKSELEARGVAILGARDHTVSQSLYVHDPDGNLIELYVDGSDIWRSEPNRVGDSVPLAI
jgi:catechol 2,3-dioxygenase